MCQNEIKEKKDKWCFFAGIFESLYVITTPEQSNPTEQEFFLSLCKIFSH